MTKTPRQQQIVDLFRSLPPGTELLASDIAKHCLTTRQSINSILQAMGRSGVLRKRKTFGMVPAFGGDAMHNAKLVVWSLPQ